MPNKTDILWTIYTNYCLEKVMGRLNISVENNFSMGLFCGACLAYETSLSMLLTREEFNTGYNKMIETIANKLNRTTEEVEEVL